jgi:RNA polymerase sigma-70 factor (ECF subfamily)
VSVCIRYVTDRETARDVLQEGFIKLFNKIDSFSGTGAFGGWVRRIFVTTALEHLRQNDALKHSANLEDVGNYIENVEETVLQKISADDLMNCIAALADGYRTIFNLYAIEGYSHAEIAEMLGITEATSRSQFMRARKILQKNVLSLHGKEYAEQYK